MQAKRYDFINKLAVIKSQANEGFLAKFKKQMAMLDGVQDSWHMEMIAWSKDNSADVCEQMVGLSTKLKHLQSAAHEGTLGGPEKQSLVNDIKSVASRALTNPIGKLSIVKMFGKQRAETMTSMWSDAVEPFARLSSCAADLCELVSAPKAPDAFSIFLKTDILHLCSRFGSKTVPEAMVNLCHEVCGKASVPPSKRLPWGIPLRVGESWVLFISLCFSRAWGDSFDLLKFVFPSLVLRHTPSFGIHLL